ICARLCSAESEIAVNKMKRMIIDHCLSRATLTLNGAWACQNPILTQLNETNFLKYNPDKELR
ncbi:MAG: hypothetical protein AB7H97_15635, partial [Pseudobdellovibrionaceae bacterium]